MEYLDEFYDIVKNFIYDPKYETEVSVDLINKRIYLTKLIPLTISHTEVSLRDLNSYSIYKLSQNEFINLQNQLKKIDASIVFLGAHRISSYNISISYSSNKLFSSRELNEFNVYYFIISIFNGNDIERLQIYGNLKDYYPFNLGISFDLQKYQREVIKNLTDKQLPFYLKLMNDIKSKKVSDQQPIVIFESSGFIFYKENDDKVKTLIFNER